MKVIKARCCLKYSAVDGGFTSRIQNVIGMSAPQNISVQGCSRRLLQTEEAGVAADGMLDYIVGCPNVSPLARYKASEKFAYIWLFHGLDEFGQFAML
jgi:hypothetical protein